MPNPPPGQPRTPPRFVPTLTEVVHNEPVQASPAYAASTASPFYAPQPPISAPPPDDQGDLAAGPEALVGPEKPDAPVFETLEDEIIHRVMQRVDLSLERRLQEAVSAMVLAQTQLLVPRLREEIEFVVRQSVSDAVADELAMRNPR
ncbi:MAG: hypothetical protein JWQ88_3424 [Rhodoferax sp.]|nr:hypothetical protein [Rhodoferax sp.]